MKRFTDAGRKALADGNLYAALSLALMLPDICGSIEDPGPSKSQRRYERWCRTWLQPKFTRLASGFAREMIYLTAEDCYQLRCSLIHSGSAGIETAKRNLDRVEFFDNTTKLHCTYVHGPNLKFLQLNAEKFSLTMYDAVDEWDASIAGDSRLQAEKDKLLVIHSAGETVGGVYFTSE